MLHPEYWNKSEVQRNVADALTRAAREIGRSFRITGQLFTQPHMIGFYIACGGGFAAEFRIMDQILNGITADGVLDIAKATGVIAIGLAASAKSVLDQYRPEGV